MGTSSELQANESNMRVKHLHDNSFEEEAELNLKLPYSNWDVGIHDF